MHFLNNFQFNRPLNIFFSINITWLLIKKDIFILDEMNHLPSYVMIYLGAQHTVAMQQFKPPHPTAIQQCHLIHKQLHVSGILLV